MASSRRPTIAEVARQAGCSTATVSRVINRSGPTSAEVRDRVETAIGRLGFRPNAIGRSLKTQRTRTIGCIIPSLTNPVFASSVSGIESSASADGWSVLLAATDYKLEREGNVIETLLERDVEGLILTVADADRNRTLDMLDVERVPYVLAYNEPRHTERPAVTVDNALSTQQLTQLLIESGHRRIAYVAGRFATSDRSRRRHEGYLAALDGAGIAPLPVIEVDYMASDEAHRLDLATRLADAGRPTALMCSNDLLAVSVISALRASGYRVPDDISVTGFDGIALGQMVSPTLATIDQRPYEIGRQAAHMLFQMIERGTWEDPRLRLLDHELRPGESLASAPDDETDGGERSLTSSVSPK